MRARYKGIIYVALAASVSLTGCGGKNSSRTDYKVRVAEADKVSYETIDVQKGDISPELQFSVSASVMETVSYYPTKDDMTIKSFNYKAGDIVHAGDTLIEFENEDLDDKIRQYEDDLGKSQLLLDHLNRTRELDENSYITDRDIEQAEDAVMINSAYLQELQAQKEAYNVVAKGRGIVTTVSNMVEYGNVNSNDQLFNVVYGDGCFYAYLEDEVGLKIGDVVQAAYGVDSYDLKLFEISEADASQGDKKKYEFEYMAVDDEIPPYSSMDVTIKLPAMKNVIYIPKEYVYEVDKNMYVMVLGADGYGYQREIKVSTILDGKAIVTEGLDENERIMVK